MSTLKFAMRFWIIFGFSLGLSAQEPTKKDTVPNRADVEKVQQRLKNLFKEDYAKLKLTDRQALGRKLLQLGLDTKDDSIARYAMLREACDLAAKAGDARTSLQAILELNSGFAIDVFAELDSALSTAAKASNSRASNKEISQLAIKLIPELIKTDHYDIAHKVASVAKSSALKARDNELINETTAIVPQLDELRVEYEKVSMGIARLQQNREDADANLVVGKFLCLVKDEWTAGLTMLLKSADPKIREIVEQEIAEPQDSDKQASLGDAWWQIAETENPTMKTMVQFRALYWYKRAMPRLTGLKKVATEDQIKRKSNTLSKTLVNAFSGEVRRIEGHQGSVWCVALSHDGRLAVSGGPDKTLRVWELESGKELRQFTGHTDGIRCVAFSPRDQEIISGAGHSANSDKIVRLWKTETGRQAMQFAGHRSPVLSVAISPDNRFAVSGGDDASVRLWDCDTGGEVRSFVGHEGMVTCVRFVPDGRRIVSCGYDKTIRVWEASSGRELGRFGLGKRAGGSQVRSISVSPNGKFVLAGYFQGPPFARLWDLERGEVLFDIQGHSAAVNCAAISPDSLLAVTGSDDNSVRVWNLENGNEIHRFESHAGPITGLAFTPTGRHVLSSSTDGTIRLWRLPF